MVDSEFQTPPQSELIGDVARERWARKGRDTLSCVDMPNALRGIVSASLDTPQFGRYHNEGLLMDSHLGLMLDNVEKIQQGTFDFSKLGLSEEQTREVQQIVESAVRAHTSDMAIYAYLHDVKKPDCMNVEIVSPDGKTKQQRVFTMEEWSQVRAEAGDDPNKIQAWFESHGIKKIGYRQSKELTGTGEDKEHGSAAVAMVKELASRDPETEAFLRDKSLVVTGVGAHEMHFQVFSSARSAKQYYERVASKFSPEQIDFILTVNLLDIASALNDEGEADYAGFKNMLEARACFHRIIAFKDSLSASKTTITDGSDDEKSLLNAQGLDDLERKIETLNKKIEIKKNPPRLGLTVEEQSIARQQLETWLSELGISDERGADVMEALRSGNYAQAIGRLKLGKSGGLLIEKVKKMLAQPK